MEQHIVKQLSDDEVKLRLIEAAVKDRQLALLVASQRPDLLPVLRERGALPNLPSEGVARPHSESGGGGEGPSGYSGSSARKDGQ